MSPQWDQIDLYGDSPDGASSQDEPMGSKEKLWRNLPGNGVDFLSSRRWLLKLARVNEHDSWVSGEDWAEWVVHHLAFLLGIPSASIRPATLDGARAILSRSVLHDDHESLVHGNSLLSGVFPRYDQMLWRNNPHYTVASVLDALRGVAPPVESTDLSNLTAFDVWAGYLALDAWTSGRDRHHENWAVVARGADRRLAPSFDHGNALGFQERDAKLRRILVDDALFDRWVARGTSVGFSGEPGLVDLAHSALRLASPAAQRHWHDRLSNVDPAAVHDVIAAVPRERMSDPAATFAERLLTVNRRRLLDGYPGA
jgi:hypothetical protein